jgi:hypothetical protein
VGEGRGQYQEGEKEEPDRCDCVAEDLGVGTGVHYRVTSHAAALPFDSLATMDHPLT